MLKFNKKKNPSREKMVNTIAVKRNVYAIILSVVFIVGAVLLTVLSTILADRFPISLDLTSDKIHTMSKDNVEFIKGVDKNVNIYVCLTEEEYTCTGASSYNMAYYAATRDFVDNNETNIQYYRQTVELLKKYEQYNDKIKVHFLDIAQPDAKEITDEFETEPGYGDIFIDSTFTVNGESVTRRSSLSFKQIYTLEAGMSDTTNYESYYQSGMLDCYALYGMGVGYLITENSIEESLSAAVYKVTSESTPVFLVPNSYCNTEIISKQLQTTLVTNNFELEYVDGLLTNILTKDKHADYAGIILADCTSDISLEDREVLDAFLDNDGNLDKSLYYFAGTNTYKHQNLCAFLGDWGIGFEKGLLYETSSAYALLNDPTKTYLSSLKTDYTTNADNLSNKTYAAGNMVPMKQLFEENIDANYTKKCTVLMRTGSNGTVTVMPIDANATEWKPSDSDLEAVDAYPTVILTEDTDVDTSGKYHSSYVVAFASSDMVSDNWTQYSVVANLNFALDVFNSTSGANDTPFNFVAKTITVNNYATKVTELTTNIIKIVFMGVIPVALVVTSLTVWIWRRRK